MADKMNMRLGMKLKLGQWAGEHESQLADLKFSLHFLSKSPLAVIGFFIVFVCLVVTIFGNHLVPYDPFDYNLAENFRPPSGAHWFGTDEMGRDVFSRTLYGARYSMFAGLTAVLIGLTIGTFIGLIAGYFAGKTDEFLMRLMDVLLAFPPLVLALGITAALGANLLNAAISIGIVNIPRFARLVRSQALGIRRKLYVESAQISGSGSLRIIFRHILPNSFSPCLIQASQSIGWAIMTLAYLSFIGIGVRPPRPEWGLMASQGRDFLLGGQWWVSIFPGTAIIFVMVGFMFLGDGLRDVLDPKLRR